MEFRFPHMIMNDYDYDEIGKRLFLNPVNIHVGEFNNLILGLGFRVQNTAVLLVDNRLASI